MKQFVQMDNPPSQYTGVFGMSATIFFCFVSYVSEASLQSWAGVFTIIAAVSTAWLNISRWLKERKQK